jgi:hypothetical protein
MQGLHRVSGEVMKTALTTNQTNPITRAKTHPVRFTAVGKVDSHKKMTTPETDTDQNQTAKIPNPASVGLVVVDKNPATLNPAIYNPRRLTPEAKRQIKASIEKFGMVDPIIVNVNPERLNTVVGGHQRLKVLKELGWKTVPCVEVNLSALDEKELNLRLNRNQADWDYVMLRDQFDLSFLSDLGFNAQEMGTIESEFEKKLEKFTNVQAEMPIVPKYSEQYKLVTIFCKSELDFNFITNVLKLERRKDYKNERVGMTLVITAEDFQTRLNAMIEAATPEAETFVEDEDA